MMESKLRYLLHKSLALKQTKQVHAQLLLNRHNHLQPILIHQTLLHSTKHFSPTTVTYLKRILKRLLLHTSSKASTFSWGCLVRFLSQHRKFKEALTSYIEMSNSGVPPSSHAVTSALRACGKTESLVSGSSLHAQGIKTGLCGGCVYVQTGLVGLYSRLGCVGLAKKAFDEILDKNTVSWNSLLQGYLESGELEEEEEARRVFEEIPEKDVVSWNMIISSYAKRGDMSNARSLFLSMPLKSAASWNILIGGYVSCGETEVARTYFDAMPEKSSVSWVTMISGYAKSGDVESAEEVFRGMSEKKEKVVYDAMIACYAQNGKAKEALKMFSRMLEAGVQVDEVTLSSVVSASSQLGDTGFGAWVESYVTEQGIKMDDLLSTSLIDLYMKGGEFDNAFKLFNGLHKKDTVSYSAMIMGCGINGLATEANRLFREMVDKKIKPNQVTFTGLLSACSHSGCVQDGYKCFDSMKEHDVEPSADHYGVMVDMLGRAGRLEEAYEVIKSMPVKPNAGVWGALLLASGLHNSVEFGEIACRHCVELESDDPSGYLTHLASIYTSVGRWDDARSVRAMMEEKKLRKTLGCSWVEGTG